MLQFSHQHIPFEELSILNSLIKDYLSVQPNVQELYNYAPTLQSFDQQIKDQITFDLSKREVLCNTLKDQYQDLPSSPSVLDNIESLASSNTFTVTTGHQLTIFGSPMYFVYKIVSTIRCTQLLQAKYPDHHFVPVFWMASEDHDFEEISSFHFFNQKYTWENEEGGAVGRVSTQGLSALLDQLPEELPIFRKAYTEYETLAEATRYFVDQLFSKYGLVCIDADDASLKRLFAPIVKQELLERPTMEHVSSTSEYLAKHDYKVQVNPREINLFWLGDGFRERIVLEDGGYRVLNQEISFGVDDIDDILERPERISPNALLRPVYQQCILPNLAYIGGGGELSYWLQLKSTFDHFNKIETDLQFPILMLRNMALIFTKSNARKYDKLWLSPTDLFLHEDTLRKQWVAQNSQNQLKLDAEKKAIQSTFEKIQSIATTVDQSLEKAVASETQKALKIIANLEKRIEKAEERRQETSVKQLVGLKQKLFPSGKLQERHDSHLDFAINDPDFVEKLVNTFDPFSYGIYLLRDVVE